MLVERAGLKDAWEHADHIRRATAAARHEDCPSPTVSGGVAELLAGRGVRVEIVTPERTLGIGVGVGTGGGELEALSIGGSCSWWRSCS